MSVPREVLLAYYDKIFPVEEIYKWISYGSPDNARNREISFASGEFVKRFMTFPTAASLRQELMKSVPEKMDFGAIFNHPCEKKGAITLTPEQRELVFDIDVSDYDNVRACCSEKTICYDCWALVCGAVRALSELITTDLGYSKFFWVYSGRRGVHCWVCDESARKLTDDERGAIVSYLSVYESGGVGDKATFSTNVENEMKRTKGWLHPSIRSVLQKHLLKCFENTYLNEGNKNCVRTNEKTKLALEGYLNKIAGREKGFDKLIQSLQSATSIGNLISIAQGLTLTWAIEALVLATTYPRLDVNVSKMRNHLLKSPWVVHPGTGRVCVPLDVNIVEQFDPTVDAPSVGVLVDALQQGSAIDLSGWLRPMQLAMT
eukprot:PhF_6_TR38145/c0_g1_i1/m.56975/K02684/PRI1; DNA primase small subunit